MCTAITYKTHAHYFGRNLDWEHSFGEEIVITPRKYPLKFKKAADISWHYAMIGAALRYEEYPLYFDAVNEKGLAAAGLNFPKNAHYKPYCEGFDNITPFEFIPYILSKCQSVSDARKLLSRMNIVDISFSDTLPLTPLHWIIADKNSSITVEPSKSGVNIYENEVGVLTNNPPFDMQLFYLSNFLNLTSSEPVNRFTDRITIEPCSRGLGAYSLPGDLSSPSRFVKAAFTKLNSPSDLSEDDSISQFFHILSSAEQQCGTVKIGDKYEKTIYSSCCNTDKGIYYYKTYNNSRINAVSLEGENLEGEKLISHPFLCGQDINFQN